MDCGSVQDVNWEEPSQTCFQVTLRAAQNEAVSTGRHGEYHSYDVK
jgi:hypothetical protein